MRRMSSGGTVRARNSFRATIVAQVAIGMALLAIAGVAGSTGQTPSPDGNPFRGRDQFVQKRCSTCHAVWGHGGTLGPEITVAVAGKSFYELVGDFWNHTPQMIDQVTKFGYPWPTLDATDMADLLSYLYYLRLFDEPGNAQRGADTYARLQCGACHALGSHSAPGGVRLDRFAAYSAPTPLAQAMWNAGPQMQQEQIRKATPIPQLGSHDMADLQAYIRAEGRRAGWETRLQPLPNPARGATVFRDKKCGACHDRSLRLAPDLARSALSKTASEITALLWNHSFAMGGQMRARGVPFPRFVDNELSDLIAYLYFLGYVGQEGDAKTGSQVFAAKGCAGCHKSGAGAAPDLARLAARTDRAGLASAMWNHAPQMHSTMAERSAFWPKFEPGEMRNLAAYLRALGAAETPRR